MRFRAGRNDANSGGTTPEGCHILIGVDIVVRAWDFLVALPEGSFIAMFWLTILAELPRYFVGVQATAAAALLHYDQPVVRFSMSILLVGPNEEGAIESCVRSLHKQTFNQFEIVCVRGDRTTRPSLLYGVRAPSFSAI
jgi:hypothetical protein